jgi:hypothetical protein
LWIDVDTNSTSTLINAQLKENCTIEVSLSIISLIRLKPVNSLLKKLLVKKKVLTAQERKKDGYYL